MTVAYCRHRASPMAGSTFPGKHPSCTLTVMLGIQNQGRGGLGGEAQGVRALYKLLKSRYDKA